MNESVLTLSLCRFSDVGEEACFFFQLPEEPMMVFRKCSADSARCIDTGTLYVFASDVPVAPQHMH